ncbi:glycosyltransferase [Algibacillus agarilyticus]|uniref:glycosyltransferase n=1 Tax=Algibacillus agarilyticus TaxID=2234133 RepID=UPI0018E506D2|nr:glycosyltransferase [Algibacillus agarilyticus]
MINKKNNKTHLPMLTGQRWLIIFNNYSHLFQIMGGTLLHNQEFLDELHLVFLFDETNKTTTESFNIEEIKKHLQAEIHCLYTCMGEKWTKPIQKNLIDLINSKQIDTIFTPALISSHNQEKTVTINTWQLIKQHKIQLSLYAYMEKHQGINNKLVDITPTFELKQKLINQSLLDLKHPRCVNDAPIINTNKLRNHADITDVHSESFFLFPSHVDDIREIFDREAFKHLMKVEAIALPLVSVLIRTKQRPSLLIRAIQSVVNQRYQNIELIIVNDDENELNIDWRQVEGRFKAIKQIEHQKTKGRAAAANSLLQSAQGEYCIYLDDDDEFDPDHIESLVNETLFYNKSRICYAGVRYIQNNTTIKHFTDPFDKCRFYTGNFIPIHAVLFPRLPTVYRCKFDINLDQLEDWDFWLQLSSMYPFHYTGKTSASYHAEGNSGCAPQAPITQYRVDTHHSVILRWLNEFYLWVTALPTTSNVSSLIETFNLVGQVQNAEKLFNKYVNVFSGVELPALWIKILLSKNELNKAEEIADQYLTISDSFEALLVQGELKLAQNKKQNALQYFQQAKQVAPHNLDISLKLCNLYANLGLFSQALHESEFALQNTSTNSSLYKFAGQLSLELKNNEKALNYLECAFLLNNELEDLHYHLGLLLQKKQRPFKALYCLYIGAHKYPNNSQVQQSLDTQLKYLNSIPTIKPKVEATTAIVIVNYYAQALLLDLLDNIQEQIDELETQVEVIIVDNGSTRTEQTLFKQLPVKYIFSKTNIGYAGGVNLGVKHTQADYIFLMNPDLKLTPNCLKTLLKHLQNGAATVAPKLFWDDEKTVICAPTPKRTFACELLAANWNTNKKINSFNQIMWRQHAYRFWQAKEPIIGFELCGAFLGIRRDVWNKVGAFDEKYQLYFEETEWLQRLKNHGFNAYYVPQAEAIHYYNQSSRKQPKAALWFAESAKRYYEQQFGPYGQPILSAKPKVPQQLKLTFNRIGSELPCIDLTLYSESAHWLEVSQSPSGVTSSAINIKNLQKWSLPKSMWDKLTDGQYYLFLLNESKQELARFVFEKQITVQS